MTEEERKDQEFEQNLTADVIKMKLEYLEKEIDKYIKIYEKADLALHARFVEADRVFNRVKEVEISVEKMVLEHNRATQNDPAKLRHEDHERHIEELHNSWKESCQKWHDDSVALNKEHFKIMTKFMEKQNDILDSIRFVLGGTRDEVDD